MQLFMRTNLTQFFLCHSNITALAPVHYETVVGHKCRVILWQNRDPLVLVLVHSFSAPQTCVADHALSVVYDISKRTKLFGGVRLGFMKRQTKKRSGLGNNIITIIIILCAEPCSVGDHATQCAVLDVPCPYTRWRMGERPLDRGQL